MRNRRRGLRWSSRCLVASIAAVCALASADARADIVLFKTGRVMSVQAYRVEGDLALVVLRDGGEVSFPASLIEMVRPDEVPYPAPHVELAAELAPVTPAAGPDGAAVQGPPLTSRPFAGLISSVAERQGVEARLVHAVIEVESNYQSRARSTKGAKGLMQLMPETARQYAVRDPYDPLTNIEAGVRHLKSLMSRFDLSLALAAYNAGEATVLRYGGLPPFPETRAYVQRILQKAGR